MIDLTRDTYSALIAIEMYESNNVVLKEKDIDNICYLMSLINGNTNIHYASIVKSCCFTEKEDKFRILVKAVPLENAWENQKEDLFLTRCAVLFRVLIPDYSTHTLDLYVKVHQWAKKEKRTPGIGVLPEFTDYEVVNAYMRLYSHKFLFNGTELIFNEAEGE